MPWKETNAMNEKMKFILAWTTNEYTVVDLCKIFKISRETAYKFIKRYKEEGANGLSERSRAHHRHPDQTNKQLVDIILKTKNRYPKWGPKKIKAWLEIEHNDNVWPAASTISSILQKNGLVITRKKRIKTPAYTEPFSLCDEPNAVWSADFKGYFKLGSNDNCYPLTISDNYSRYLICCDCFDRPNLYNVKQSFEYVFKEYGLPKVIKTDNGSPFASVGVGGLSQLSIWWLKLGIIPERIALGRPDQNGRHERMHRTLKEATSMPPKSNMYAQQIVMDEFRQEYNNDRPHEALGNLRPSSIYKRSSIEYPKEIPEIEYNDGLLIKKVRTNGELRHKGRFYYVSSALSGERIALRQINDDCIELYFSVIRLGVLDLRQQKVIRLS